MLKNESGKMIETAGDLPRTINRVWRGKKGRVNCVVMALDDKGLLVWNDCKKKIRKNEMMVLFEGKFTNKLAISGLRLVLGHLEKEGLPIEPAADFVHMDYLLRNIRTTRKSQRNSKKRLPAKGY